MYSWALKMMYQYAKLIYTLLETYSLSIGYMHWSCYLLYFSGWWLGRMVSVG